MNAATRKPELLAPAGDLDSAYAAIHYGADAVYLGLQKFSARAEAQNLTLDQVREVTGYAHGSSPRRKVFATVNTVVLDREVGEVTEALAALAEIGVDAVVVQDLGVARIVRTCFPTLRLHASTQLAIHNLAGARVAAQWGFHRVTLARELTVREIRAIAAGAGIEIEVFVHGALCYSYSGLCLFSSLLRGRSGNRGRCTYPCRDLFTPSGGNGRPGAFIFSMKDLALPDAVRELGEAGVTSLKVEGRKKSALYVACATSLYRRVLDGAQNKEELRQVQDDIRTVFSRPWTGLYLRDEKNRDVVDTQTVGHRGALIGTVEAVARSAGPYERLRFTTRRAVERHDGIQVDLPEAGRPYGFAVDALYTVPRSGRPSESVIAAPAGAVVEVTLPARHPRIPVGANVYSSSSQQVKRTYRFTRPRPGEYRVRLPIEVTVQVSSRRVAAHGRVVPGPGLPGGAADVHVSGTFGPAEDQRLFVEAAQQAFARLGETQFALHSLRLENEQALFAPVSLLNVLRRDLAARLAEDVERRRRQRIGECITMIAQVPSPDAAARPGVLWSVKVDRLAYLAGFREGDLADVEDIVVDIGSGGALRQLSLELAHTAERVGRQRLRLGLPPIVRDQEWGPLVERVRALWADGWRRWEASGLAAWSMLADAGGDGRAADLTADWTLYVLNRAAALELTDRGIRRFVLSAEDGIGNMAALASQFPDQATVCVHQDVPLFISDTCAFATMRGRCRGARACDAEAEDLVSSKRERVTVVRRGCRSIVLAERPFSVAHRLRELRYRGVRHFRADFVYRPHTAAEVLDTWRALREGRRPRGVTERAMRELV